MKLCEIMCSGSDERYQRKIWIPFGGFIETDLNTGRIFFRSSPLWKSGIGGYIWMPTTDDLLANDWEFWSMPDAE